MTSRRLAACAALLACTGGAAGTVPGPPEPPASRDQQRAALVAAPAPPALPTQPPAPAPRAPREVSIVMGGDLLWHDTVWQSAAADAAVTGRGPYDFDPMFADLRPVVQEADLALCHEEVPFARPGQALQSFPVFAAPPQVAPWIASMGFDACTTASNHAVDQGWEGLVHTADLLDRHGVAHVGTFRSRAERREPVVLTTDAGVRVGLVAGTYGLNGFPLPEGRPWSVSLWDADDLLVQAHRARAAGADVVVVHLHGGNEYDHLPNAEQVALVERLTRSPDVDLVLGDHAHVVQPITRVHGTWVVYGMGNLVAQQETFRTDTYEGVTVRFTFRERPDGRFVVRSAAYLPTAWNVYGAGGPIRVLRVVRALAEGRGDRARLLAARASVRAAVNGLGRTPGLVER
ncbi:CapA family protein [Nocardioides sp.]|uniref:CapA family protein n=1 Tax=Nocardioides sp. TaxID=35761 RepID=UPI0027210D97|nr:CapA family protein [Nocardioides sp.]MDO9457834.1 CapA family protein [Nocardioides sp.]